MTVSPSLLKVGLVDQMDPLVQLLSVAVLRSAFVEPDTQVRSAMWRPLLTFLKGMSHALRLERLCEHHYRVSARLGVGGFVRLE